MRLRPEPAGSPETAGTHSNQRLLLLATFVSGFGTGADTLLIGKILYDATGSVAAFESVFLVQYLFGALSNLLLGPGLDRGNPRRTIIQVDSTRACLLLVLALAVTTHSPALLLVLPIYGLKLNSQIYQIAMFTLVPKAVPKPQLVRFAARSSGVMQGALLSGAACVGFVLMVFPPIVIILFDSATFLASVALLSMVRPVQTAAPPPARHAVSTNLADWRNILRITRSEPGFQILVLLSAAPAIAVSLINVWLAPLVAQRFHGIPLYLSLFDGAFASGAILVAFLTNRLGDDRFAATPLLSQTLALLVIAVSRDGAVLVGAFLLLGAGASASAVYFNTRLQTWGDEENRAKIFGLRTIVAAVLAVVVIPVIGAVTNRLLALGIAGFSALLAICSLVLFILPRLPANRHTRFYDPRGPARVPHINPHLSN